MIKRALISVSDKQGIIDVAKRLHDKGIEIISTGGTAKVISEAGISVTSVDDVTQFPECFGGRVKTMHPMIMGGVLFRREHQSDPVQARELGIEPIDLVIVNLYPFEEGSEREVKRGKGSEREVKGGKGSERGGIEDEQIELIDIGGPTLLRSAAKNFASVTVVTDPTDYNRVLDQIEKEGDTSMDLRRELAGKVFQRTAAYDSAIMQYFAEGSTQHCMLVNKLQLRYGENPHQAGAYFDTYGSGRSWNVIQEEKKMSYLNLLDADGAWNLVKEFDHPTAACIKHANPCGVASHADISEAFQRAYDADRLSAFGVIIALNRPCTAAIIQKIIDQKIFTEVIIAPKYEDEAIALLKGKPKIRALEIDAHQLEPHSTLRSVFGGVLMQDADQHVVTEQDLTVVSNTKPTPDQINDLLFAWKVVKHAKSNAIVFAKDQVTVGIGCGQTSRVDSAIIASRRAGDRSSGAVMASDAFFPFPDSVEEASRNGITAIIQPGGSIRDAEVFAKAEELGIAMVTTGVRAFRH